MNPSARRALDLRGEFDAVDTSGNRVRLQFEGEDMVVCFGRARDALAAARSARALRASGLRQLAGTLARHSPAEFDTLAVDFILGERRIGRAGRDATPNWLGRALGAPQLEVHAFALLAALLSPGA